jgi:hypothetical protein
MHNIKWPIGLKIGSDLPDRRNVGWMEAMTHIHLVYATPQRSETLKTARESRIDPSLGVKQVYVVPELA